MRKIRIAMFFIMIILGLVLGLIYGWIIDPVTYQDTSADMLRADYKADYVLMVAQIYQKDGDLTGAVRRLALLDKDKQPPEQVAANGLKTARDLGYASTDLEAMDQLALALLAPRSTDPAGGQP